ncbi:PAAR-like domain-containing protein [Burkholderia pseudomultivorans]|uniref:PAAR-like domain-containing protein n=1 Tax=Burkholderia pseudomultivorans TaxID=1207504 RepID=UPI0007C752D1|nr:PAAR-like domain-containing protein [Burkholderia pseudomultivorans]
MAANVMARKDGQWTIVSMMPDVCKTPMGSSTPPVPYPVTASLGDSQMTSKTVFANGNPIVRFDSSFAPETIGDQAGVANGVESGTVGAKCWPIDHSKTVRVESKMVVRHSDQFWMNGNYVGKEAKAARWRGRKAQIAEAREKVGSLPPGAERDKLQAAADRFERNNSVVEQAKLAQDVYNPRIDTPEGWNNVSGDPAKLAQYKLKPSDFSIPGTNFRAQVYEPDKEVFGNDFKPQVVFQGTDKYKLSDWKNNLMQGMNKDSAYYSRAVSIGKALAKSGADVNIVGHSLGGGMASAASRTSGIAATTFNAAGLNPSTVARYGGTPVASDIQAYHVEGEILTATQENSHGLMPTAVGEPHILPGQGGSLGKHGMDKVIDGIEQQKTEDQTTIVKELGR